MVVRAFIDGEVLYAADTNTYLNYGGLVWLKSQTVGTAVTSVNVTAAFTSEYDNYRIIYTGGLGSTTAYLTLQFGIGGTMTATGYSGGTGFINIGGSTWNILVDNGATQFNYAGGVSNTLAYLDLNVDMPQLAKQTLVFGQGSQLANGRIGFVSYVQDSATQFTSFRIAPSAGTITGGTISVYGYRKP